MLTEGDQKQVLPTPPRRGTLPVLIDAGADSLPPSVNFIFSKLPANALVCMKRVLAECRRRHTLRHVMLAGSSAVLIWPLAHTFPADGALWPELTRHRPSFPGARGCTRLRFWLGQAFSDPSSDRLADRGDNDQAPALSVAHVCWQAPVGGKLLSGVGFRAGPLRKDRALRTSDCSGMVPVGH